MGCSHGSKWTDEKVEKVILDCMSHHNITRMPSRSELVEFTKSNAVPCRISKTIGYYGWAERLGLKMKKSDTQTGKIGEEQAVQLLRSKGFDVERMTTRHPYDLLVNGCVKVDVKTSHLYRGAAGNFYTFNLEKRFPTCDAYFLIAKGEQDRIYIVPAQNAHQTQISIGETTSIYHSFENRYDIIESLSEAFKAVI